jgi:transcription elongation factor Elf1
MTTETNLEPQDEEMVAKNNGPTKKKRNSGKPNLKPVPHSNRCSFCNRLQSDVPLMVRSPVTNSTICSFCAMNIVEQSMGHMVNVASAFSQVVMSKPEWFDQDEETGAIQFINPEEALQTELDAANDQDE